MYYLQSAEESGKRHFIQYDLMLFYVKQNVYLTLKPETLGNENIAAYQMTANKIFFSVKCSQLGALKSDFKCKEEKGDSEQMYAIT